MAGRTVELGNGVFALRYAFFDQTIGVIVGEEACLVIDTRTTYAQARELTDDVRRITQLPVLVLNTHHHFDHTFGNAVFRPAAMWGLDRCAARLRERGEEMRHRVIEEMPELSEELREIEIVPPTETFEETATIDLGGRTVDARYLGRGHTDNDVVAIAGAVTFAGDLVEQGAPPSFGDSFPLHWPKTNERLLELVTGPVVPGHGEIVDAGFVRTQLEEIGEAARLAKEGWAFGADVPKVCRGMPFPEPAARDCVRRAWAQLDGTAR